MKKNNNESYQFQCNILQDSITIIQQDLEFVLLKSTVIFAAIIAFNGVILIYNLNLVNRYFLCHYIFRNYYIVLSIFILVAYYLTTLYSLYNSYKILMTKPYERFDILGNLEIAKNPNITLESMYENFLEKNKTIYQNELNNLDDMVPKYKKSLNYFLISIIIYLIFVLITIGV